MFLFRDWLVAEAKKEKPRDFKLTRLPSGEIFQSEPSLWGDDYDKDLAGQFADAKSKGICISGFVRHADFINRFAQSSPENMAQTIMFAVLTANRQFSTIFGYFPVLVSILKNGFKGRVNPEELILIARGVEVVGLPEIRMLINRDSANYVSRIWGMRNELAETLEGFRSQNPPNWVGMMEYLTNLKIGLGHVKAAFAIQLVYGALACLDTHNIRVYAKLGELTNVPDQDVSRIRKAMKLTKKTGSQDYIDAVKVIMDRFGLQSQHFWDIWNDYVVRRPDSVGDYSKSGPVLNPLEGIYQDLLAAIEKGGKWHGTPIVVGDKSGMGGSLAHLAATSRGQEDFTQGLPKMKLGGKEMQPDDWRGAVNKFAHQSHPAFRLARLLSSPQGIMELKRLGEKLANAGSKQMGLFGEE